MCLTISFARAAELNCSNLADREKPQCLSINCKKDLEPLKDGEILITLGKRSIARIIGNSWKSTFEGKELNQVRTLYNTQNKKAVDIEQMFDYDVLQDKCFTYAKPKSESVSDNLIYSSKKDIKFGIKLSKEQKKLLHIRVPTSKNSKFHMYDISDLNENNMPEVWYRSGEPGCFELEVLELTIQPTAKLVVFPFSYECGE